MLIMAEEDGIDLAELIRADWWANLFDDGCTGRIVGP
jgi:hypothetical protein